MTSAIKKLQDSKIELTISLEKDDLLSYIESTERQLARGIKLKGFRLGKAPKDRLRKEIGEDKIREESLKLAVESSLKEAIAKEGLDVVSQLDFKIKENSSQRVVYQATFLVFPELILGQYKGLGFKRNIVSVTDPEIGAVLEDIQKSRTVFNKVKRPAKTGDRVEIDFTIKHNSSVIDGGRSENHPLILGDGKFVPGFEEQIAGMETGQTKHFLLEIPADFYQKSIAGKELDFEVVMKKVEGRTVPELNDKLVKTLGNFRSLEELKVSIKQGLTTEKEIKERDRIRLAILERIASATKVKVPPVLIENQLDTMIHNLDNELHQKGMELGLYLAHLKKTQDDLRHQWRARAESQVKMSLVARAIAKAEEITVGEDEINEELQIILQQYLMRGQGAGPEAIENINTEELKNKIRDALLNEKVFGFLEKQNIAA